MNYLAHALPFLDEPYLVAGSGVPDMLTVADRGVRLRARHAQRFLEAPDPVTAAVASGIAQHFRDDSHFHQTAVFAQLSGELTTLLGDFLAEPAGLRPRFLGHLLVELLLDAVLAAEEPRRLDRYYRALAAADASRVQEVVNRLARRPTDRLAPMLRAILRERFLSDYLEDATLLVRLDQIMRRVRMESLPEGFRSVLGEARRLVARNRDGLLEGIPVGPVPRLAAVRLAPDDPTTL